jgi:DNA-binding MarR family transcriptional regulator
MNIAELIPTLLISLMSLFKKNIKLNNVTFPQAIALYMIPDQGIEMSILSKKIGVDLSTLSRLINGLQKRGLVKREISKKDRRIINILLKEKGVLIREKIDKNFDLIGSFIEKELNDKNNNIQEALTKVNWGISKILLNNEYV